MVVTFHHIILVEFSNLLSSSMGLRYRIKFSIINFVFDSFQNKYTDTIW